MMGVATLPAITAELIKHGLAADTPAMTVADAAMPSQQAVRGTVADIAALTKDAGIKPPAITVIGAVPRCRRLLARRAHGVAKEPVSRFEVLGSPSRYRRSARLEVRAAASR